MLKWKIGAVLVLLILFLPMIANAEETTKVYSSEEIRTLEKEGYEIIKSVGWSGPEDTEVGKPVIIDGYVPTWINERPVFISDELVRIYFYKNSLEVFVDNIRTDENGFYKSDRFIPREPGYYKASITVYYGWNWHPTNLSFYVSEKDTDGDSVPDKYDYAPYDPNIQTKSDNKPKATPTPSTLVDSDGDGVPDKYDYAPYNPNVQTKSDIKPKATPTPPTLVDSDGDGVPDKYDYAPYDPNVQTESDIIPEATLTPKPQGFEIIFAFIGLLTIAYFLKRKKEGK